jgi:hypothetical protein
MAYETDALLREVDEELRRERLTRLWDQYGTYVVALAALIIAGVGGYKYWQYSTLAAAQSAGSRYQTALTEIADGDSDKARTILADFAKNGPTGYATLANIKLAGEAIEAGKTQDALTHYEKVAGDSNADGIFRDFAILQIAQLKLGGSDWTATKNRLNELTKDDRPWRHAARELLGVAAFKAGNMAEARQYLEPLAGGQQNTPPAIAERARIVMSMVSARELAATDTKSEGAAPGKSSKPAPATKTGDTAKDK